MASTPYSTFGPRPFAKDPGLLLGGPTAAPGLGAPPPLSLPGGASPAPINPVSFVREQQQPTLPAEETAVQKLRPGSDLHRAVHDKLEAMWKFGKEEMKKHYSRWNFAEQKIQAYTSLQNYQDIMASLDQPGALPPEPINVVVPYQYATLHAAATFIASVLLGRKPVFPLIATRGTESERARYMEQAVQSNLDASRGYEQLWQHIWDTLVYSFAVNRCQWDERVGPAIRWVGGQRESVTETTFAGNVLSTIDPYAYVPDPRVPIHECNIRGDFIFTEMQQSETVLKDLEKQGSLKWVDEAIRRSATRGRAEAAITENARRTKIGMRGEYLITPSNVVKFHRVKEGTVRLVPKDWGLGASDRSELWKFSWIEGQIMQAEPLGMMHGQHPYVASEPTSFGHDFMSVSMSDMIGPFQDVLSWLVSSRMENVRVAISNQFVADPARVEVNDIRTSAIGRVIRLKQAAIGLPVKDAIMQLAVMDVTQGHLTDIQTMRILADTITGVNDNMRGIQTAGGRRSATEARMSMQAGASRLSQLAVRISAQAFLPLANQMIMNIQQFMPDQMWVETTGDDGQVNSNQLTPDMLVGSFNYQVSDGSLPFDKMALVESWKEILFGIARDPELRQRYDLGEIFNYVAILGGAKNIESFKRQPPPPGAMPMIAGAAPNPGADPNMQALGTASPFAA